MTKKQIFTYITIVIGFGAAGYLLYHTFREYSLSDIVQSVRDIPTYNLVMAGLFAA